MAKSSSTTLTKFISATTIVTADVANKWYGGLYGSTEGANCDADDPLVAGHVHDGQHIDGHSQKIHLVNHVTSQLRNINLADDAVVKRNVQSFTDVSLAIPEYEDIGPDRYYYLDLSILRSEIGGGAFSTTTGLSPNITSNTPGDLTTDDFVFGSNILGDDGSPSHDARFLFDKSQGAFRAGSAAGDEWNEGKRGSQSAAFGRNNQAIGARSTIAGGDGNAIAASAPNSFIGSGNSNQIAGTTCVIVGGSSNTIETNTDYSFIGGGSSNTVRDGSTYGYIAHGTGNEIEGGVYNAIFSGSSNSIEDANTFSIIAGGWLNSIKINCYTSAILSGLVNIIGDGVDAASYSSIIGGSSNAIHKDYSIIAGGQSNTVTGASGASGDYGTISGGRSNVLTDSSYSVISGGQGNAITNSPHSGIVGGEGTSIIGSPHSFIGAAYSSAGDTPKNTYIDAGTSTSASNNAIVSGRGIVIENLLATPTTLGLFYNLVGAGSENYIYMNDPSNTGGTTPLDIAETTFNTVLNGDLNRIQTASYCSIVGGAFNTIEFGVNTTQYPGGFSGVIREALDVSYSVIRGGSNNLVSTRGMFADVGGSHGFGHSPGQFVIGGGTFDGGFGEAQTSTIVASREFDLAESDGTYRPLGLGGHTADSIFGDEGEYLAIRDNSAVLVTVTWVIKDGSNAALAQNVGIGAGRKTWLFVRKSAGIYRHGYFQEEGELDGDGSPVSGSLFNFNDDIVSDVDIFGVGLDGKVRVRGMIDSATSNNYTAPSRMVCRVEMLEVFHDPGA